MHGQGRGLFLCPVNLCRAWAQGGGAQVETRPARPRGSGVKGLHPGACTSLHSSVHRPACDATVCKHNVPLYDSHCDMCFFFLLWFIKKFLKELEFLIRFVTSVLADCQTSVVNELESPWIHPTNFKSVTDVHKLKAYFVVDLLYYLNENKNLTYDSLIFGLTFPMSV